MDKKKKMIPILIGAGILVVGLIIFIAYKINKNKELNDPNTAITITVPKGVEEKKPDLTSGAPSESGTVSRSNLLTAYIGSRPYAFSLEGAFVDTEFKKLIPFSINLENRDGNKLVGDFNSNIAQNDKTFDKIQVGDVMLYQGNKMVIFYKEVESPEEQYTKLGNLQQFGSFDGNITITFDYK